MFWCSQLVFLYTEFPFSVLSRIDVDVLLQWNISNNVTMSYDHGPDSSTATPTAATTRIIPVDSTIVSLPSPQPASSSSSFSSLSMLPSSSPSSSWSSSSSSLVHWDF